MAIIHGRRKNSTSPFFGCSGGGTQTLWYGFIAPPSGLATITTETIIRGTLLNSTIALYRFLGGDCTDLTDLDFLDCNDDANTSLSTIEATGLTPGVRYYIQVAGFEGSNRGSFCIEVYDPAVDFPPNDDLCDATALTVGDFCTQVNGNTARATTEPGEPIPDCLGGSPNTVWYSFVAPPSGMAVVTTETGLRGSLFDSSIGLYGLPGGDCTDLTDLVEIDCNDDYHSGLSGIEAAGLTPGETYFVQVAGFAGGQ